MSGPIYEPRGAAKEYGDYAINIYTGCPHRCWYCFAPGVLHQVREDFHSRVEPRKILVPLEKQLAREDFRDKTVHLCFTCDPYPTGYDSTPTREVIKLLKAAGAHVQILTKGDGSRDFDLLDGEDWYGITLTGAGFGGEPKAATPITRFMALKDAKDLGIKTWISFEPVIDDERVFLWLEERTMMQYVDRVKIGKLNYHPSGINWAEFGRQAEALCQRLGLEYTIKASLRREMER